MEKYIFNLLFSLLFISFCNAQNIVVLEKNNSKELIGKGIGSFDAFLLDSSKVNIESIRSKYILICFWSSSCELCHEELQILSKLQQIYHKRGLKIIAYSIDTSTTEINENISDSINNLSFWWSTSSNTMKLITELNIYKIPYFILLDKKNKIIGIMDNREKLLSVLNEKIK